MYITFQPVTSWTGKFSGTQTSPDYYINNNNNSSGGGFSFSFSVSSNRSGDTESHDVFLTEAPSPSPADVAREGFPPPNSFNPESGDRPERCALAEPMHRRHTGG